MGAQVGGCFSFENGSMENGGACARVFPILERYHGNWGRKWEGVSHLRMVSGKLGAHVGGCFSFENGSIENGDACAGMFPI